MKDKTVFITGGNEGIGLSTAVAFAKRGNNVAILGRRADKNDEGKKRIEATGARCIAIAGDVTNESVVADAVKRTCDTFGGLHYAFNNAGVGGHPAPFPLQGEDEFERIININLKGVWLSMKHELPAILASGGGAIVNTGSIASTVGLPMMPIYTASKHAVLGLTRAAALEYARQGVRINAICPGTTGDTGIHADVVKNTPDVETMLVKMVPMGRLASPDEMSGIVLYLCSDAASYVTGQAFCLDGGFTAA